MVQVVKTTFHSLEFIAFCYATESEEKVANAILSLIPDNVLDPEEELVLERERLTGQYNEPLEKIKVKLTDPKKVLKIMKHFAQSMKELDKKRFSRKLNSSIDQVSRKLHFRLDKDASAKGMVRLGEGSNVIKVVLKFKLYTKHIEPFIEELQQIGLYIPPPTGVKQQ